MTTAMTLEEAVELCGIELQDYLRRCGLPKRAEAIAIVLSALPKPVKDAEFERLVDAFGNAAFNTGKKTGQRWVTWDNYRDKVDSLALISYHASEIARARADAIEEAAKKVKTELHRGKDESRWSLGEYGALEMFVECEAMPAIRSLAGEKQ